MKKIFVMAMAAAAVMGAASCAKTQEAAQTAKDVLETSAEATTDAAKETVAEVNDAIEAAKGGVVDLDDDNAYRPGTKVKELTILDFNATWCGPCRMLAPVFEDAAKTYEGKVRFVSVDIDKCTETAQAFGVEAVPTVVFLRPDGKSERFVGTNDLLPASKFDELVKKSL